MIIILIIISKKAKCSPNTRSMRIKLWFPRTIIVKKMRKIRPQKQRFSIRKFTVGGCFCTNWFNLYRC